MSFRIYEISFVKIRVCRPLSESSEDQTRPSGILENRPRRRSPGSWHFVRVSLSPSLRAARRAGPRSRVRRRPPDMSSREQTARRASEHRKEWSHQVEMTSMSLRAVAPQSRAPRRHTQHISAKAGFPGMGLANNHVCFGGPSSTASHQRASGRSCAVRCSVASDDRGLQGPRTVLEHRTRLSDSGSDAGSLRSESSSCNSLG